MVTASSSVVRRRRASKRRVGLLLLLVTCRRCSLSSSVHGFALTPPHGPSPRRRRHDTALTRRGMALLPVPVSDLQRALVLGVPTGEQWGSYWGRTSWERYNAVFESVSVSFLGLFASYFLSFVVGAPLATLSGAVALCWGLLGPEWRAYQRNWELRGGRDLVDHPAASANDDDDDDFWDDDARRGLYGAYWLGSVATVAVVEDAYAPSDEAYPLSDFADYTMERDDEDSLNFPWQLRLRVRDGDGRTLQVHARMSEEYADLRPGMPLAAILLSTSPNFTDLAALTDLFVPDADCWVGDYPYLNKDNFCNLLRGQKMRRLLERERV